jgi:hypothetical protein
VQNPKKKKVKLNRARSIDGSPRDLRDLRDLRRHGFAKPCGSRKNGHPEKEKKSPLRLNKEPVRNAAVS